MFINIIVNVALLSLAVFSKQWRPAIRQLYLYSALFIRWFAFSLSGKRVNIIFTDNKHKHRNWWRKRMVGFTWKLTTKCWKSQERIILVACLGRTPLFCFFLFPKRSSSSSPEPPLVAESEPAIQHRYKILKEI